MSRYQPSPTQLAALRAIAAGRILRLEYGPYRDTEAKVTYSWTTVRRLIVEELVVAPPRYGALFEITDAGRKLLATLDGAS